MVTDQKRVAVPDANPVRERTQLVKPHNNISAGAPGSGYNNAKSQITSSTTASASAKSNAVGQRAELAKQLLANAQQAAVAQSQEQMTASTNQAPNANTIGASQGQVSPASNYNDDARNAIRQMDDNELDALLTEISTGKLRGNQVRQGNNLNDIFTPQQTPGI